MRKALLLSGGMDSVALAYRERPDLTITIDYGQVCAPAEIQAAGHVSAELAIQNEVLRIDCHALGSGDLAGQAAHALGVTTEWWPYRNQLLITLAAMRAVSLDVQDLMIATVASDGNYRDGTVEFIERIDGLLSFQEGELRVSAPAISLSSADLIKSSGIPFHLLAWAHSCHRANYACGDCRGCYKHQATMNVLGYGYY